MQNNRIWEQVADYNLFLQKYRHLEMKIILFLVCLQSILPSSLYGYFFYICHFCIQLRMILPKWFAFVYSGRCAIKSFTSALVIGYI